MRILVVTGDFPSDFDHVAGVFIFKQVAELQRLGHDVSVLRVVPLAPPVGAKWQKYRALGDGYVYDGIPVTVARTVILPGLRNFEHLRLQTSGILRRAIARVRPDVIHAHYLQYSGSIAVDRGKPVVITSHGIDAYDWPWRREGLHRDAARTLERAQTVVAVSGFIATSLRRLFDRNVEVVFNGGDSAIFSAPDRARARVDLKISPERKVLAFAGTLCEDKGIFDLAPALCKMPEPPMLLVLGDGPDAQRFRDALESGRVEARFFGNVKQADVATAFAAADVVTLPSHKEGLPVTVCEAMLSARPVVATRVGGIPEILSHEETGYLVDAHDLDGLSSVYGRVFGNLQAAGETGRRAASFARARLTWEANARSYDRLYRDLVGERAA